MVSLPRPPFAVPDHQPAPVKVSVDAPPMRLAKFVKPKAVDGLVICPTSMADRFQVLAVLAAVKVFVLAEPPVAPSMFANPPVMPFAFFDCRLRLIGVV